jgi:hypothetical protein
MINSPASIGAKRIIRRCGAKASQPPIRNPYTSYRIGG